MPRPRALTPFRYHTLLPGVARAGGGVESRRGELFPSTQNVSAIGGDWRRAIGVPVATCSHPSGHMGGGFGCKFPADPGARSARSFRKRAAASR